MLERVRPAQLKYLEAITAFSNYQVEQSSLDARVRQRLLQDHRHDRLRPRRARPVVRGGGGVADHPEPDPTAWWRADLRRGSGEPHRRRGADPRGHHEAGRHREPPRGHEGHATQSGQRRHPDQGGLGRRRRRRYSSSRRRRSSSPQGRRSRPPPSRRPPPPSRRSPAPSSRTPTTPARPTSSPWAPATSRKRAARSSATPCRRSARSTIASQEDRRHHQHHRRDRLPDQPARPQRRRRGRPGGRTGPRLRRGRLRGPQSRPALANAAKEIKGLIQDSVQKVEAGSALVHKSGETLTEIVGSVKRVTDIIAEIAAASQEQSTGIDQVNRAVTRWSTSPSPTPPRPRNCPPRRSLWPSRPPSSRWWSAASRWATRRPRRDRRPRRRPRPRRHGHPSSCDKLPAPARAKAESLAGIAHGGNGSPAPKTTASKTSSC